MDKGAVERQPILASAMGDYNQDGVVNAGDYLVWQKSRGATGVTPYTGADGTGDGNVDQADYRFVAAALWFDGAGRGGGEWCECGRSG